MTLQNPFYARNRGGLELVTPFIYRDGLTLLQLIEETRAMLNGGIVAEINDAYNGVVEQWEARFTQLETSAQALFESIGVDIDTKFAEVDAAYQQSIADTVSQFDTFKTEIRLLVESINNRVGNMEIQRIVLDSNKTITPQPEWTTNQPILHMVTQDATGGRTLTLSGITGSTGISSAPNSISFFNVIKIGSTWRAFPTTVDIPAGVIGNGDVTSWLNTLYAPKSIADIVGNGYKNSFTVKRVKGTASIKEHTIIRVKHGNNSARLIGHVTAGNSLSATPPRENLDTMQARTGGNIVVNASGWWEPSNRLMGLHIVNGTLVQGWATSGSDLGQEAFVVMKNGECRIYDTSTTPQQIIADGGYNSFSWGSSVYRDGVLTNFLSIERYAIASARTLIGVNDGGDVFIMLFKGVSGVSGATGADILAAVTASGVNFKHLYILDGGGSTQALINGEYHFPSSDGTPRPVPNAITINAPLASPLPNTWKIIAERANGASGGGVSYLVTSECVFVRVAVVNIGSVSAGANKTIAQLPSGVPLPLYNEVRLAYLSSKTDGGYNARVSTSGEIQLDVPSTTTTQTTLSVNFVYPIERNFE